MKVSENQRRFGFKFWVEHENEDPLGFADIAYDGKRKERVLELAPIEVRAVGWMCGGRVRSLSRQTSSNFSISTTTSVSPAND